MTSNLTRRKLLNAAAAAPAILKGQGAHRPNVLFLLSDDQRVDTIRALGNSFVHTPNLDGLVRRGMSFSNAYCMGGNQAAVCTPSRNMILSGRAYTRYETYAPATEPNFPDAMKALGYETYHHGKKGNSALQIQDRFETNKYVTHVGGAKKPGETTSSIADEAEDFLLHRRGDRPFFMYLGFEDPHDPRVASPQFHALYAKSRLPLPKNYLPVHPFDNGEMTIRDELLAPWPRTEDEVRRQLADYYASVSELDFHVGRIVSALKKSGQYDNTIIIFSSDHGLAMGSHGLMGKQSLYDHSMKSPLLFSGPGIPHGRSDAMVYLLDIFPTVLELAGAPVPPSLDGISFAAALTKRSTRARPSLFLGYRSFQRACRDERYKLLLYPQINRLQLFDLRNDPDEITDLSQRPEHRQRIAALKKELAAWQRRLGDALPLETENPGTGVFTPPDGEALKELRKRWWKE